MNKAHLLAAILILFFFFGCTSQPTPQEDKEAFKPFNELYYMYLNNGTERMESGNYVEAMSLFTRARLVLADAYDQLKAGCKAEVYSNEFCEGEKIDLLNCKMEVVTFYENSAKLLEFSNPGDNCNLTMDTLRAVNIKCTSVHQKYGSILDEWKNITAPEKVRLMCNLSVN